MIKISGKLKTKQGEQAVDYMIFETDGKILRIAHDSDDSDFTKEWFDLRPIGDDNQAFSEIIQSGGIEPELKLPNRHGYGMVLAHGIFQYNDCEFLVTDPFGGQTFYDFINGLSLENSDSVLPRDILSCIKDITHGILTRKEFHGYLSWQTVLIETANNACRSGIICFPDQFPVIQDSLSEWLLPKIYQKMLANKKLTADDDYSVVLIILQLVSLNMGITEPCSPSEILNEFHNLLREREISRFYNSKIYPWVKKLLNGATTFQEIYQYCQDTYQEIDLGERLGENLERELSAVAVNQPKLTRARTFSGHYCPYCGALIPSLEATKGCEACPVCRRTACFPRKPERKICKNCRKDFDVQQDSCLECAINETPPPSLEEKIEAQIDMVDIAIGEELDDEDPLLGTEEFDVDLFTPLKTLLEFENQIEEDIPGIRKTQVRAKMDRSKRRVIPDNSSEKDDSYSSFKQKSESGKQQTAKAKSDEFSDSSPIQCRQKGGDIVVQIDQARPARWQFIVALDDQGDKVIEKRETTTDEPKSLQYIIPLDEDELADKSTVYIRVYQDDQLLTNQKIVLSDQDKSFFGKIWKK